MSLRDYVLSGCVQELEVERQLAKLEREMTEGASDDSLLDRYARAQARLESYGGYLWRDRATVMTHGLGFSDADLDRGLDTFSGGQLTRASLARALATNADVLLLDEPTNHLDIESLEWLEQTLVDLDAAVMLVAHDRWFLEAVGTAVLELYGDSAHALALLRRYLARVATRAGRARDRAGQGDRQAAGRDRAHGALRRALPRQGHQGAPSPVARQAAGQDRAHRARPTRRGNARVLLQGARAQRPRDLRAARTAASRSRAPAMEVALWFCSTTPSCGWSAASTSPWWGQRRRQDNLDRDAGRTSPARRGQALAQGTTSPSATSPSTPRSWAPAARQGRAWWRPPSARPACPPTRRVRWSAGSCSPARMPRSRWKASPAASAAGCRWRS